MLYILLNFLIWTFFKLLQFFYVPLYVYKSLQKSQFCPPIKNDILLTPANVLVKKIATREISCEETITAYIDRIKDVNPIINAVVENRFDLALKEAKEIDEFLKTTTKDLRCILKEKPLLGVPISVKQSIQVAGMKNNAGSKVIDSYPANEDAKAITLIKKSGAIILVTTNTPEYCLSWDTFNNVTGRTNNPYDTRRSSGGSSGGEAALISSCGSVIGIASDVGGSIRSPATFCGIFGHKPTRRLVSVEGHKPSCIYKEKWSSIFNFGPMTRYASDLPLLLSVISEDGQCCKLDNINMRDIRIYYMENDNDCFLTSKIDPEITEGIRKVLKYFQTEFEIIPEKVKFNDFKFSPSLSYLSMLNLNGVKTVFIDGKLHFWQELLKFMFGLSAITLPSFIYEILSRFMKCFTSKETLKNISRKTENLKAEIEGKLGNNGILIYPSFTSTALFHNQFYSKSFDFTYFALFNVLGLPVTSCPIGFSKQGLPIGIQVVAKSNCDRLCLKVAEVIERGFKGWQPPPIRTII